MKSRLTAPAERDIARILRQSLDLFGPQQARRYQTVITNGIAMLAGSPLPPTSRARDDIGEGIRSFHLQIAGKRRGSASHVLFYQLWHASAGEDQLLVLRILGDRSEPKRRVAKAAREAKPDA